MMRILLSASLLALCCVFAWAEEPAKPDAKPSIVGKWSGTDTLSKQSITIEFKPDGGYTQVIADKAMPLPEKASITYTLDTTKSPMHVDIIFKKDGKEEGRLKTIAEFVGTDKLKMQLGGSGKGDVYPEKFEEETTITLERKK